MKKLALVMALAMVLPGMAIASDITMFHPGTGQHNVLPGGRDACWSEPPDLNGLIGSSEQILMYGLESENANDFVVSENTTVTLARFWGGYWNSSVACVSGMTYQCHNLRFYEDAGCIPARLPNQPPHYAEYISINCDEGTMIYCQTGWYPIFDYQADVSVPVIAGYRYWFGAQMCDHPYPPQWGRLTSAQVVGCISVFWSPYFGYPEWEPCCEGWGCFDLAQEFECGVTATSTTSWGAVKRLYR